MNEIDRQRQVLSDRERFARNCMGVVPVQRLKARTSAAGSE